MPLCSRCTGFYALMLAGIIGGFLFLQAGEVSYTLLFAFTMIALAPFAADGVTQLAGWRESSNNLRFVTGALAGAVIGVDIAALVLDALFL
jgi:uncharacterized membrane protein